MAQFLGFGSGGDGDATLSGTDAPIDSAATATAGTRTISATNASFAAGQIILIHQSRGTGAGTWELHKIQSYVAGTITTEFNLVNSYSSLSQVLVLKQYRNVTVSGTFTVKNWNGTVGGIMGFLCAGATNITGTITATGTVGSTASWTSGGNQHVNPTGGQVGGYRGGTGHGYNNTPADDSGQGEGTAGGGGNGTGANGNGGGGGDGNLSGGSGGGGGANGGGGSNGTGAGSPGTGGSTAGSADLVTMVFGGGGGGGNLYSVAGNTVGGGGSGGAIVAIFSNLITITGSVNANGGSKTKNGGGGGGGSILIKAQTADVGTNKITASGGTGTDAGGDGGTGRIRVEACTLSGSTNSPSMSSQTGGFDYCGSLAAIIG